MHVYALESKILEMGKGYQVLVLQPAPKSIIQFRCEGGASSEGAVQHNVNTVLDLSVERHFSADMSRTGNEHTHSTAHTHTIQLNLYVKYIVYLFH